jgi:hypothetical protein
MEISDLASFLDVHSMGTATEENLTKQSAPRDELGVKVVNILYNLEVGSIYCILDLPTKGLSENIMNVNIGK